MEKNRPGIQDLAHICGVSKTTVSAALGASGRISEKTRGKIRAKATALGWRPDPHLSQLMGYLRHSRKRNAICNLAWLNTSDDPGRWQVRPWFQGYLRGARERAHALGYHLDEIWSGQEGMNAQNLGRQLLARGVSGILLPLPEDEPLLRALNQNHFAWVVIDESEMNLPFHHVHGDRHQNVWLLLEETFALGYRKPALFVDPYTDRISQYSYSSSYLGWCYQNRLKARIPSPEEKCTPATLERLLHREKPDLLVGSDNRMVGWLKQLGLKVPGDIGVVHLNLASDVPGWAGIEQNHDRIGALAVEQLVALLTMRQFGASSEKSISVQGIWRAGKTVRKSAPAGR